MDIISFFIVFLIVFLVLSACGCCCRKTQQGQVISRPGENVTVSSAYPTQQTISHHITVPHQMPHAGVAYPRQQYAPAAYTPIGFGNTGYPYQIGAQHVGPYPVHVQGQATQMPQPVMGPPYPTETASGSGAPYPTTAPYPPQVKLPSYQEAVSAPPPTNELYAKQAPYNPNF